MNLLELKLGDLEPAPDHPRKHYSTEAMEWLEKTIERYGLQRPVLVRKCESGAWMIVDGERRRRAVKALAAKHPGDPRFETILAHTLPDIDLSDVRNRRAVQFAANNIVPHSDREIAEAIKELQEAGVAHEDLELLRL